MFTARKKIAKEKGQEPDSFEESVAQVQTNAYKPFFVTKLSSASADSSSL